MRSYVSLPRGMAQQLNAFLQDPEYTSLKENIAFNRVRLSTLAGKFNDLDTKSIEDLFDLSQTAKHLIGDSSNSALQELWSVLADLISSIEALQALSNTYKDIQTTEEHIRKMADTENKMISAKTHAISSKQLFEIIAIILHSIYTNIEDDQTRKAIGADIQRATNLPALPDVIDAQFSLDTGTPMPDDIDPRLAREITRHHMKAKKLSARIPAPDTAQPTNGKMRASKVPSLRSVQDASPKDKMRAKKIKIK